MALIVQKYGGTSVANPERIKNVAARVARYRANGDQIVVVAVHKLVDLAQQPQPAIADIAECTG